MNTPTPLRVIAVDPGLHHTGWGVVSSFEGRTRFIAAGVVDTNPKDALKDRLLDLNAGLSEVIGRYNPDEAAIEETFINTNARSSLKLGHARGALMLTLAQAGLPISEYSATHVKKSVTGVGRAEKHQVIAMVNMLLPSCNVTSPDAADALALCLCHIHQRAFHTV